MSFLIISDFYSLHHRWLPSPSPAARRPPSITYRASPTAHHHCVLPAVTHSSNTNSGPPPITHRPSLSPIQHKNQQRQWQQQQQQQQQQQEQQQRPAWVHC